MFTRLLKDQASKLIKRINKQMTQNHIKIRNSLFKSSVSLTDVLARCALIEKEQYYEGQFETKSELKKAIIQAYVGILKYTAQVHALQPI